MVGKNPWKSPKRTYTKKDEWSLLTGILGLENSKPVYTASAQFQEQEKYNNEHEMVFYINDSEIPFSPTEKYLEPAKAYDDANITQIPWNEPVCKPLFER